jgi:hypothetical protein
VWRADSSGVFTVQFISYAYSDARDKAWVRVIVAGVTAMACLLTGGCELDTLTAGYNWFYSSHVFVYNFGVSRIRPRMADSRNTRRSSRPAICVYMLVAAR